MNDSAITRDVLDVIYDDSKSARSKDEVLASIYQVLSRFDVDPSGISLETWKQLLVVAFSAAPHAAPVPAYAAPRQF